MSDPQALSDLLDGVLERLGIARPGDVSTLVTAWDLVAGDPWAGRSRPARLESGELLVEVDDGGTASLLRYQISALLARLEQQLGAGLVTAVRLRIARPGPGG